MVVFLCSFVNHLPGNTIKKMLFTLNFVLLHDIHLPTIFKSTELQYELPKPQWQRQDFLKTESDAYVLGRANDLPSRNHVDYKNACKSTVVEKLLFVPRASLGSEKAMMMMMMMMAVP